VRRARRSAPAVGPAARGAARSLATLPVGPELIVAAPFLGIAQHLVGFVDLFELRFAAHLVFGDIRVIEPREFAESLLDLFGIRRAGDAERFVIVWKVTAMGETAETRAGSG
jgi:hypothetical protein